MASLVDCHVDSLASTISETPMLAIDGSKFQNVIFLKICKIALGKQVVKMNSSVAN